MTRQRRGRPGGSSWQDAQRNAPGAYVPAPRHGSRSDQSDAILAWLRALAPRSATSGEVHHAVILPRWPTWTQGQTTSRLGTFCTKGLLIRVPGGLYQFIADESGAGT